MPGPTIAYSLGQLLIKRNSVTRRVALVLLVVLLGSSSFAYGAPVEWSAANGGNGHFYDLVFPGAVLNWNEARAAAAAAVHLGAIGHLVTITTAAENEFLRTTFADALTVQRFATGDDQPGDFVFIGLSDAAVEGRYEWVTGEPFSFADWGPFEPNNLGNQDYGIVRVLDDGRVGTGPMWQWDDNFLLPVDGVARLGYIVEFDVVTPIPLPGTVGLLVLALAGLGFSRCRR